jgi:hypothetical protein
LGVAGQRAALRCAGRNPTPNTIISSDIPTAAKADAATRSRAQVRAETISARNSADARAARDLYLGGAQ